MSELFEAFQEFRKILCICPCCGEIVRVSDLKLRIKGSTTRTWLDDFQKKMMSLDEIEQKFDEKESKLREIAVEKGRKKAEVEINKMISPALKALKLDPYDIKPISNPVDFIVFNGMNKKEKISDVMLLSKNINNPDLNAIRNQVSKAILSNKYEWQVARIDDKGNIAFE
jgi:predicted Holliday junction resolvase-like endonuclease